MLQKFLKLSEVWDLFNFNRKYTSFPQFTSSIHYLYFSRHITLFDFFFKQQILRLCFWKIFIIYFETLYSYYHQHLKYIMQTPRPRLDSHSISLIIVLCHPWIVFVFHVHDFNLFDKWNTTAKKKNPVVKSDEERREPIHYWLDFTVSVHLKPI